VRPLRPRLEWHVAGHPEFEFAFSATVSSDFVTTTPRVIAAIRRHLGIAKPAPHAALAASMVGEAAGDVEHAQSVHRQLQSITPFAVNVGISNTCEGGRQPILDEATCRRAATALGITFRSQPHLNYAPGGCMEYDGSSTQHHGVYLNTHSGSQTGTVDHHKVCQVSPPPQTIALSLPVGLTWAEDVSIARDVNASVTSSLKTEHHGPSPSLRTICSSPVWRRLPLSVYPTTLLRHSACI
jgi:hypothetical protein